MGNCSACCGDSQGQKITVNDMSAPAAEDDTTFAATLGTLHDGGETLPSFMGAPETTHADANTIREAVEEPSNPPAETENPATVTEEIKELPQVVEGPPEGPVMHLTFRNPLDGQEQEFEFRSRPLGIDFQKSTPLRVGRVQPDTSAAECGVIIGSLLICVNGENVVAETMKAVQDKLRQAALPLAMRPKQQ